MTKQRRLIFEIIQNSHRHLTAEEIFLRAKEKLPNIAMGTVYRNLGLMVQEGEINRISIPNAPDKYDKNPIIHDHAVCVKCGRAVDVKLKGIKKIIENDLGKNIISYDLNINYICSKCDKKS